jgi:hypothetical protein
LTVNNFITSLIYSHHIMLFHIRQPYYTLFMRESCANLGTIFGCFWGLLVGMSFKPL